MASETSGAADYDRQLDAKHEALKALFAGLDIPTIEVFASAPRHYRMRAEFRIWHEDDAICYAMFSPGQKASSATLQRVEQFPPACEAINALMPRLLAAASADPVLRRRWYQVEFLATLSGEMLVTMVYHRPLDDAWEAAARQLQTALGIHVIGRSRGQKRVLSQDFVSERLEIPGPDGAPPSRVAQCSATLTRPVSGETTVTFSGFSTRLLMYSASTGMANR